MVVFGDHEYEVAKLALLVSSVGKARIGEKHQTGAIQIQFDEIQATVGRLLQVFSHALERFHLLLCRRFLAWGEELDGRGNVWSDVYAYILAQYTITDEFLFCVCELQFLDLVLLGSAISDFIYDLLVLLDNCFVRLVYFIVNIALDVLIEVACRSLFRMGILLEPHPACVCAVDRHVCFWEALNARYVVCCPCRYERCCGVVRFSASE